MIKKYIRRIFAILCCCFISLLIKSEDKGCSTYCTLAATNSTAKSATVNPVENNKEILTYYGFYSKY